MTRPFLDWSDMIAVRRFLVDVKVQADDIDGAVLDTFNRARKRRLGPALVRETYGDAMRSLRELLAYGVGPDGFPDDKAGTGDPAGSGGAGPIA